MKPHKSIVRRGINEEPSEIIPDAQINPKTIDKGILNEVLVLRKHGVDTFESCQGGVNHSFPEPTIKFHGDRNEGIRVAYICLQEFLSITEIRRTFSIENEEITMPYWEVVFKSEIPKGQLFLDRKTGTFRFNSDVSTH